MLNPWIKILYGKGVLFRRKNLNYKIFWEEKQIRKVNKSYKTIQKTSDFRAFTYLTFNSN